MTSPAPSQVAGDASGLAALIREQAATEAAQLLNDAQAHAERARAAAAAEVESIRAAAAREGGERGQRRAATLLAVADAQGRLTLLQTREAHITDALARTRDQLANLSGIPNAAAVLASFIREALQVLPPGSMRVQIQQSQAALLDEATRRQLAAGRWALRFETAPVPGGGVVVETEDGRLYFDNSMDARIRRRGHQLRLLAVKLLWPPAGKESRP